MPPSRFNFAVISDLHIALPHTIWDAPNRFHLVEVSILAFEQILTALLADPPDFLLLPGDLVQHGERENHQWLAKRLAQLPFPAYVVPGNHDVISRSGQSMDARASHCASHCASECISLAEFPQIYQAFGYRDRNQLYYQQEVLPGVHLIGLNSNAFDDGGEQLGTGYIDQAQLSWLDEQLAALQGQFVMVMVHHNLLEHLPGQAASKLGQRYMIRNAPEVVARLQAHQVAVGFTGHLHVQDIAQAGDFYAITTGSLVSYPHPYRRLSATLDWAGHWQLQVSSSRIESVPGWPSLQETSRAWMSERSHPFLVKLLTDPPLSFSVHQAKATVSSIEDFWATVAAGDALFDYAHLPEVAQRYFRRYEARCPRGNLQLIDNQATLKLRTFTPH